MFGKLKSYLPSNRTRDISEEDLKKYTGMTKSQLEDWSKDRPDVAGNQLAGKINMGTAGGGGLPNSFSYTGRGTSAKDELKFPPGCKGGAEAGRAEERAREKARELEKDGESD